MGIQAWAQRVVSERAARDNAALEKYQKYEYVPGFPVPRAREIGQLPGETHGEAAKRNFDAVKDWVWRGRQADNFAEGIVDLANAKTTGEMVLGGIQTGMGPFIDVIEATVLAPLSVGMSGASAISQWVQSKATGEE